MSIAPGCQLGPYQVTTLLGAGGMGEVYRAQDTRLGRAVAIKILPSTLSTDPERLRRFEQEARAVAALNHANILAVHDVGSHEGTPFIVSELLVGETLRERLNASAMPVRLVVDYAVQIAHGLAAAHEKGIVHRDLKPENIFLTSNDRVKILDFGLAKLLDREPVPSGSAMTALSPDTAPGFVLGTVGYMAPEQVRGVAVDHRADIFAFGTIVFEMLAGRRPFIGDTSADTMTAILKEDAPDLPIAERRIPPALARVVHRCLHKNPAARFQSAGDLAFALEALSGHSGSAETFTEAATPVQRARRAWMLAAGIGLVVVTVVAMGLFRPSPAEDSRTSRFPITLPQDWTLAVGTTQQGGVALAPIAVSRDGWQVAIVARNREGSRLIWIHSRDALEPRPLAGTENAYAPFWSPDGRFVAFFADGKLKKIDVSGKPTVTLCDAEIGIGGTWSSNGIIVFAPSFFTPLQKIAASGGTPVAATVREEGESYHSRPSFLPDGKHFLYSTRDREGTRFVYHASVDSLDRTRLVGVDSSNVVYSQGHLLFLRQTTLIAQPFDLARLALSGEPIPIAEQIETMGGLVGAFSASENGVLVYQSGALTDTQLAWFDRSGKMLSVVGHSDEYNDIRLSVDGKQAAVSLRDPARNTTDIWVIDAVRGTRTRLTTDPADDVSPVWSPDGMTIAFASRRAGKNGIYRKPSNGAAGEDLLIAAEAAVLPANWSRGGDLLYMAATRDRPDVWVLPLAGNRKPAPFAQEKGITELPGAFSPDGRWIAYFSNRTGRMEVYVAPFPGPGGPKLVSIEGGGHPRWRGDGKEIFYVGPAGRLMVAAVTSTGGTFEVGTVRDLFSVPFVGARSPYDVAPDGQRFLIHTNAAQSQRSTPPPMTVVVNWPSEFKQ